MEYIYGVESREISITPLINRLFGEDKMRHKLRLFNLVFIVVFIFSFTACTGAKTAAETKSETAPPEKTAVVTTAGSTASENAVSETTASGGAATETAAETTAAETTALGGAPSETTVTESTLEKSKPKKPKLKIDGKGPAGGFIIFLAGDEGYIEAAPYDQRDNEGDLYLTWDITPSDNPDRVTGALGNGVGTGINNTQKIVDVWGEGMYAAKICYDLSIGGYSDWYLPSKDELNLIYTVLSKNGVSDFEDSYYWSSTETDKWQAWLQWMDSGDQEFILKDYIANVRAVRAYKVLPIDDSLDFN